MSIYPVLYQKSNCDNFDDAEEVCSGHLGHSHMFRSLKDSSWDRVRETFVLLLVLGKKWKQSIHRALHSKLYPYTILDALLGTGIEQGFANVDIALLGSTVQWSVKSLEAQEKNRVREKYSISYILDHNHKCRSMQS